MKTPEEIKKGLEFCAYRTCNGCPYEGDGCGTNQEMIDALEYIVQLEARIDTLTAKAVLFDEAVDAGEKYKRERDTAVRVLEENKRCETCMHYSPGYFCTGCMRGSNWQWRGVQEVE